MLRSIDELSAPADLIETGYGIALLGKLALFGLIAAIAWRSRRRAAAVATEGPRSLGRSGRGELALAVAALLVAAILGTIAPPAAGGSAEGPPPGLTASGSDFATTVRVDLAAASDQPGSNRFEVAIEDYDTGEPVDGRRVSLRFVPLDDPVAEPSELRLSAGPEGTYSGAGANLSFDGRWEVTVLIEGEGDSVEVPLELDLPIPEQLISPEEIPGKAPEYTLQTTGGYIRLSPHPLEAGPSKVLLTIFTEFSAEASVADIALTIASGEDPPEAVPLRRLGPGTFAGNVELREGAAIPTVIAYARDGTRLRGTFELEVPAP